MHGFTDLGISRRILRATVPPSRLDYPTESVKRPQYFGTLTNDIVYKRLAPGVLTELKKVIPKTETGRRKGALSQGLTRNIGYPKLREHLGATVAFMKLSKIITTSSTRWTRTIRAMASSTNSTSTTNGIKTTARACKKEATN